MAGGGGLREIELDRFEVDLHIWIVTWVIGYGDDAKPSTSVTDQEHSFKKTSHSGRWFCPYD